MKTETRNRIRDNVKAPDESVFRFPEGLPAFEHIKEFVFLHKPDTSPFIFMRALGLKEPSFVCIDPCLIYPEYKVNIDRTDRSFLRLNDSTNVLVLSIVTVAADMRDMTANMQGPIVLNLQARLGRQIISDGGLYGTRYRIWDALTNLESESCASPEAAQRKVENAKRGSREACTGEPTN